MKIETGTPVMEGIYVGFCTGLAGYTEKELLLWYRGGWHYRFGAKEPFNHDTVRGWIGPLPNNPKMSDFSAPPAQEFDL